MKHKSNLISIPSSSYFRLDPALTGEEAIVLRALAAGRTDGQVCKELNFEPDTFLRMMRDMREKIGTADNISLIEWAKHQLQGVDQRIGQRIDGHRIDWPGRSARLA